MNGVTRFSGLQDPPLVSWEGDNQTGSCTTQRSNLTAPVRRDAMSKCCCCNDGPSLADDPTLVFSIYAIAFIPLAFIYALDFITDKWRTIRETRRNGMIQLFISLPSLGFVAFYIAVQIENKDYKEAAAAIAVAVFNSFHVLRSIWGLILLYEFRNWNVSALRCLERLGYYVPHYDYSDDVQEMLSKMKSFRSQWKRSLLRLVDYFKTKFVSVYNWSLSWVQPVSPMPSSIQSSSSSALPDSSTGQNPLRPSHESNSSSSSLNSTIDGNNSRPVSGQNSFHSILPDSIIVENHSLLFRPADILKTIHMHFKDWAINKARPFCKDMKDIHNWAVGNMESTLHDGDLPLEYIKRTVDYHMVVNSSLIDNEFSNVELPVRLAIFSRASHGDLERHSAMARFVASCLKSRKSEECSVRWLVSFLARFGSEWLVETKGLNLDDIESETHFQGFKRQTSQKLAVLASAHTTRGSVEENGSTEKFMTLRSPAHEYSTGRVRHLNDEISITQQCMLPFKMNGDIDNTLDFYFQKATIRDAAKDDWHKTSLNELEDDERSAVENITSVQLAYFSKLMEESVELAEEGGTVFRKRNAPIISERKHPSIDTLIYQLGIDTGEDCEKLFQHLPLQNEIWSSFLWGNSPNSPNYLLLQTSVHVDNFLALHCGNRLGAHVEECETTSELGESDHATSVFENQYDLEMRRLRSEVANSRDDSEIFRDTPRFIGCVAETVRSILGSWVAENDAEASGWNASIAPVGIRFMCSEQLCSAFSEIENSRSDEKMRSLMMRLIWEVQSYLQWKVGKEFGRKDEDIRKSPFLIMLFILGFPSLKVETTRNEGTVSGSSHGDPTIEFEDGITVNPVAGPQELRIYLTCDQESKKVSVVFRPKSHVFKWQEWKDAFMGRLAAQNHFQSTRLSSNNELLRAEANHSDICSPVEYIAPEMLNEVYGLRYWSGWPPFMPQIAQFEIQNLMESEYGLCYSEGFAQDSTVLIGALNKAMDIHFEQRAVLESIYTDGHRAREEGRVNDALRLFGRCIAHLGHREALIDAFDIVMRQSPVCDNQVVSLQMQMDVRFKNLLDRSQIEEQKRAMDEIDLVMLADYFGRIYEQTGSEDAGVKKALALFYENGTNSAVSEAAIEALESFIVRGSLPYITSPLLFYLAIAHQSRFHESPNRAEQNMAVKCLSGLRFCESLDGQFALNIGYLLEKGFFVGRDTYRKNVMIETFCKHERWGDEKMLRAMFDRLFVKQNSSEEGNKEVNGHGRALGIGRRPKDALLFYNDRLHSPNCINRLGLMYHKGAQGILPNASEAEDAYLAAIEEGNDDALCNMGVLKSDTAEDDTGISYLKSTVEAGSSTGMNNLAVSYELGRGVNRDVIEAERLYQQAIEVDDNPIAMYNLAVLYMWGDREVRTDGNISHSQRIISELTGSEAELEPLYTLEEQVRRLDVLNKSEKEPVMSGKVEVEEFDECLAFVKILEFRGEDSVGGDEES